MIEVEIKKESTDKLIDVVSRESASAQIEEDAAKIQADETNELARQANETKAAANKELEAAIPAMKKAEEAVKCLSVKDVQELKSLQNPPPDCLLVTKAILILKGDRKNHGWPNAQKMMQNPKTFLESLVSYDGNNID
jgi:dynein heavy chain